MNNTLSTGENETNSNSTTTQKIKTNSTTTTNTLLPDIFSNVTTIMNPTQNTDASNNNINKILTVVNASKKTQTPEEFANQKLSEQEQEEKKQQEKEIRKQSEKVLDERFHLSVKEAIKRPALKDVFISSEKSILQYILSQNLACAFDCCSKPPERIEELANIAHNTIPEGMHIHIVRYKRPEGDKEYWEGLKLQDPYYASQYFQAYLRSEPQDPKERSALLDEFRKIFALYMKKNAQK